MKRRQPNPRLYLALAALTVLVGGGAVYLQFNSLSGVAQETARLKLEAKNSTEIGKELEDAKALLVSTSEKLQHLEKGVPETAYVPTLLTEIENFGRSHGIEVLGVKPQEPPVQTAKKGEEKRSRKPYNELIIEIKGRGKYGSAMRFVSAMTKFPKIVAVRMVTLAPRAAAADKTVEPGTLDITVELRAYVFPLPTAQTTPEEKGA